MLPHLASRLFGTPLLVHRAHPDLLPWLRNTLAPQWTICDKPENAVVPRQKPLFVPFPGPSPPGSLPIQDEVNIPWLLQASNSSRRVSSDNA